MIDFKILDATKLDSKSFNLKGFGMTYLAGRVGEVNGYVETVFCAAIRNRATLGISVKAQ